MNLLPFGNLIKSIDLREQCAVDKAVENRVRFVALFQYEVFNNCFYFFILFLSISFGKQENSDRPPTIAEGPN